MTDNRRASGYGKAVVTIDLRAERPTSNGSPDRSYAANAEHFAALLGLLVAIAGPDADVSFDFGVVTIKEVDLAAFAARGVAQ